MKRVPLAACQPVLLTEWSRSKGGHAAHGTVYIPKTDFKTRSKLDLCHFRASSRLGNAENMGIRGLFARPWKRGVVQKVADGMRNLVEIGLFEHGKMAKAEVRGASKCDFGNDPRLTVPGQFRQSRSSIHRYLASPGPQSISCLLPRITGRPQLLEMTCLQDLAPHVRDVAEHHFAADGNRVLANQADYAM